METKKRRLSHFHNSKIKEKFGKSIFSIHTYSEEEGEGEGEITIRVKREKDTEKEVYFQLLGFPTFFFNFFWRGAVV